MRRPTAILTSLAGASAVAVGAYWLGQARGSRAVQPGATASASHVEPLDDNAKLAAAIERLDRRIAAQELRQAFQQPPEPQAVGAPARAAEAPSDPAAMDPAAVKERESTRVASIDAALKTQPRDQAWASATETGLHATVAAAVKDGAQFSIRAVRCFTSVCEMVLSASSPDQLRDTALHLAHRIGEMGSIDIAPSETAADGTASVTYRLFRKGYPRPDKEIVSAGR
jgi:hypothetical protein